MRLYICCFILPLTLLLLFLNFGATTNPAAEETTLDEHDIKHAVLSEDAAEATKGRLVFAHVIFRHGDRMPVESYPTDPYNDRSLWPTGWGQLTNLGKVQQYHLGKWLRKRYNSILSQSYSNDEFYIRSTDVDRTLMSALANLAGLYPPSTEQIWNKDLLWQPIPVHTVPDKLDVVLGKASCAAYEYELSAVLNSPEFQKLNQRYTYLYNYLTKHTGRDVHTMESVQRLNNTFFIEGLYNKTLPEWTKEVYPSDDMTYISQFYFKVATYTRHMARLKTGPLLKEMLERFTVKAVNKLVPDRNVWIYSAHDTTIANILNTLKLFDLRSPEYTACVMLEMRLNDQQEPYISIFYKNNTNVNVPTSLYIPGCGYACPLKNMFSLYRDVLPIDWTEECKLSTLLMSYEEANISLATGILVAIISVMLFLLYVVMVYYRRRSYRNYFAYSQVA